jgi:uncharacterized damage-inducible protein DinB
MTPGASPSSVRAAYDRWPQYAHRLRDVIGAISPADLALKPSPDGWPLWATAAHVASVRIYWLCDVVGAPGAESTPFGGRDGFGWVDKIDHPRGPGELVEALDSTWRVVDHCLDAWSIDMLADRFGREVDGRMQSHTRGSILQRLLTHEAYHCGELSQTLGIHGLRQIDLWAE